MFYLYLTLRSHASILSINIIFVIPHGAGVIARNSRELSYERNASHDFHGTRNLTRKVTIYTSDGQNWIIQVWKHFAQKARHPKTSSCPILQSEIVFCCTIRNSDHLTYSFKIRIHTSCLPYPLIKIDNNLEIPLPKPSILMLGRALLGNKSWSGCPVHPSGGRQLDETAKFNSEDLFGSTSSNIW